MFLTDTIVFNCFPFTAKVEPYSSDTCTTEAPETQTGLIIGVVCGVSIFNLVVGAIFIACCYRRAQKMEGLPTYNSENCQFLNTWFNIHDFDLIVIYWQLALGVKGSQNRCTWCITHSLYNLHAYFSKPTRCYLWNYHESTCTCMSSAMIYIIRNKFCLTLYLYIL